MANISYVNGLYCNIQEAKININDRGYHFGDAVYEVILYNNGIFYDYDGHIKRLFNSLDLEGVVSPPNLTASSILQEVRSGQIEHVHSIIEEFGEVISFEALKSSSIIGKPLKDIKLPKDVSLGAIVKDDESIVSPRGDTIINAGDIVVMFVPVKSMKKVEELLSVNLDFF